MASKKNTITVECGPTLFDSAEDQGQNAQQNESIYDHEIIKQVNDLRQMVEESGVYMALPPASVLRRCEAFFNLNIELIRKTLADKGVSNETIEAVVFDYAMSAAGGYEPKATIEQIVEALKAIPPYKAYSIDRYGLYLGLLLRYKSCVELFKEFNTKVISPDTATIETKREFLNNRARPSVNAIAVSWLIEQKFLEPTDFAGVDISEVTAFARYIDGSSALGAYVSLYIIAKYALLATPDELEQITRPHMENVTPDQVLQFAESAATEAKRKLDEAAGSFDALLDAENKAEREKAEKAAKDWNNPENAVVSLLEVPNIICSRPVDISPNGSTVINTFPVQRYIDYFTARNPHYGLITPMTVQTVLEAVSLLPMYLKGANENGRVTYHTTRNGFADICGLHDANQEQQLALLGALVMLSNLYVVVDRPIKYITRTTKSGKERKQKVGGLTAVQILNVPEIELQNGGVTITVTPEAMKGNPTLIQCTQFYQLRAAAKKNLPRSRFNHQLTTKGHKKEIDLLNEVFGYDERLKAAAKDPDAYKVAKKYIQNHRSDDKKKLAKWFDECKQKGIIEYAYNTKSETYAWNRLNVPVVTSNEGEQLESMDTQPDEQ